jgi:hypothetical protein
MRDRVPPAPRHTHASTRTHMHTHASTRTHTSKNTTPNRVIGPAHMRAVTHWTPKRRPSQHPRTRATQIPLPTNPQQYSRQKKRVQREGSTGRGAAWITKQGKSRTVAEEYNNREDPNPTRHQTRVPEAPTSHQDANHHKRPLRSKLHQNTVWLLLDQWAGSGHDARRRGRVGNLAQVSSTRKTTAVVNSTTSEQSPHLSGQGCTKLHGYDVNFGTREEKENAAHGTMSTPRATLARANAVACRLQPPIHA